MKKTENVFTFVTIRTPEALPEKKEKQLVYPGSVAFKKQVLGRVSRTTPLEKARVAVASELIRSNNYILLSPAWQLFLPLEPRLQTIIKTAENTNILTSEVTELLTKQAGVKGTLKQFTESAEFKRLQEVLGHSYYANIMLNERLEDRTTLIFWLRFWYFLERLVAGDDLESLQEGMDTWTPVIPYELVQNDATETEESIQKEADSTSEQRRQQLAATKKVLANLQTAQTHISKIFQAKLASSNVAAKTASKLQDDGEDDSPPPWHVTEKELEPAVLATLKTIGLSPADFDNAAELEAQLERRAAEKQSELYSLERTETIELVRGVPVRVTRRITTGETA